MGRNRVESSYRQGCRCVMKCLESSPAGGGMIRALIRAENVMECDFSTPLGPCLTAPAQGKYSGQALAAPIRGA